MPDGVEQTVPAPDDAPPIDPAAIEDAYLLHRARRRARDLHRRRLRLAGLRFWVVLLLLTAASVVLAVTLWREIEQLFGL
jgi:hypothetical protein